MSDLRAALEVMKENEHRHKLVKLHAENERLRAALETAVALFEGDCTPDELDSYSWLYEARAALEID